MSTERAKTIAGCIMILGSLLVLYFSWGEASPRVEGRPHEALGQVLAEEAAKVLGSGGRLTLVARDTAAIKNPSADFQARGFHQAIEKAKLTVSATNAIRLDPLRLVRVPPGDFVDLIRRQSENDVIASLLGPPVLNSEQRARLGEKAPHIVAVCSGELPRQVNLRELFAQNLLQVAIISRPKPGPAPVTSNNPRDWFDPFYQVITSSNLAE